MSVALSKRETDPAPEQSLFTKLSTYTIAQYVFDPSLIVNFFCPDYTLEITKSRIKISNVFFILIKCISLKVIP